MFLHEGPTFLADEDGVVAQCVCGFETELCGSKREATKSFNENHFFAGLEYAPTGFFRTELNVCTFCGNRGHTYQTCQRKPLLRI